MLSLSPVLSCTPFGSWARRGEGELCKTVPAEMVLCYLIGKKSKSNLTTDTSHCQTQTTWRSLYCQDLDDLKVIVLVAELKFSLKSMYKSEINKQLKQITETELETKLVYYTTTASKVITWATRPACMRAETAKAFPRNIPPISCKHNQWCLMSMFQCLLVNIKKMKIKKNSWLFSKPLGMLDIRPHNVL